MKGKGIVMETILNYLNNMFLNLPETAEVKRAKEELAAMMEDKYNELLTDGKSDNEAVGIVISEFGNLQELAEEIGLEDILNQEHAVKLKKEKIIDDNEANAYMEAIKTTAGKIGIATMICIWSPILMIILGGMQEAGMGVTDVILACIGVPVLLGMIAIAVAIFIINGMKLTKYDYLKKEPFTLSKSLDAKLKALEEEINAGFVARIVIGVVLCILAVIPVIVFSTIYDNSDLIASITVAILLAIISVAVYLFITAGMNYDCIKILRQENEYAKSNKQNQKLVDIVASIYWPIMVCIYLGWSFITMNWGFTWIVWPIAGVLFGVIAAVCNIIKPDNK